MSAAVDQHGMLYEGDVLMSSVARYFLGILSVAMICGILTSLQSGKSGASRLVKWIAGLVLSLCVIAPLGNVSSLDLPDIWQLQTDQGDQAVCDGKSLAAQAKAQIISEQTTAYILDKANAMGLEIEAFVTLSGDTLPVPVAVTFSGRASPYHRSTMEEILSRELGIARENVKWTE